MVDTGVNKVTCTRENLALLSKPPIATRGKRDQKSMIHKDISAAASFQPDSDVKEKMGCDDVRPFVFHRRPSKPTIASQNIPTASVSSRPHPLVEDASCNADSKQSSSELKPGFTEMPGTNKRLFIIQPFTDKIPLQKPRPRPASAHVLGERKKSQLGQDCFIPSIGTKVEKKKPRPASAHVSGRVSKIDMEPVVYGLTDNKRVSGSETDLASAGQLCLYRMCNEEKNDERKRKEDLSKKNITMPGHLQLLQPWLTDVSNDVHVATPRNCLVFVPSLQVDEGRIPVVPPIQRASDQLPYKFKIIEPEPWCPKKYDHPWRQQSVTSWQCSHNTQRSAMPRLPSLMKIYSENGQLLHMRYSGKRTANIVRKEIHELEDLLKGIGSSDGCSVVVQYQAEINHLQTMLNRTKGRVDEIERQVNVKLQMKAAQAEADSQDSFGLKALYRRHEEVITEIIRQRDLCVRELAAIEESLDLDTDRKYFKKRMQMEGQSEDDIKEHANSGQSDKKE